MTKGQIEDTLTKKATKFYLEILGVGPTKTKTYIIDDMIIIRLNGNLSPIEKNLLKGDKGIEVVKDIRRHLHEQNVSEISNIIKEITGQTVISTHRDLSTRTGEIMYVFILEKNYQKQLESENL
jgi:uncharacterized protein YbcI